MNVFWMIVKLLENNCYIFVRIIRMFKWLNGIDESVG